MTTMAVAVALACGFVSMITVELGGRSAHAAGHAPLMSAGMSLILAGLLVLAPRPGLRALAATCRIGVTRLALPATLGAGVVIAVHVGAGGAPPVVRAAVVACWWAALALGAVQTCRAIAAMRLTRRPAAPPPPPRGHGHPDRGIGGERRRPSPLLPACRTRPAATATGLGLLLLLAAFVLLLRDTHHLTAHE